VLDGGGLSGRRLQRGVCDHNRRCRDSIDGTNNILYYMKRAELRHGRTRRLLRHRACSIGHAWGKIAVHPLQGFKRP
jgi:hypothetical protein